MKKTMDEREDFKSGFAALVGRPNVGKSSFLNAVLGEKIVIISEKPQTTRNQIRGISNGDDYQIIWIDTPGIHRPFHQLGEQMVRTAHAALAGSDLVLWILDASQGFTDEDQQVAKVLAEARLQNPELTVFTVWNKVDLSGPDLPVEVAGFNNTYRVSAVTGQGLPELLKALVAVLPEGPKYYADDMVTDHPERFIVAEFIREQVLNHTQEEIPHSVAVQIEQMQERPNGRMYIEAIIYVERDSQKGIIIGAHGDKLKKIGSEARKNIEDLLQIPVFLNLWVKVRKKWRNNEAALKEFGYWEEE
jgi:GTP-binding protein Era